MISLNRFIILFLLMVSLLACNNSLFYYPSKIIISDPKIENILYNDIIFESNDGIKLHGWHFPAKSKISKGIIIQFHGNAENITSHYSQLVWLINYDYDLFVFDYRGYGISEGQVNNKGFIHDAISSYQYVISNLYKKNQKIILYGQSIGGTILLKALSDLPQKKLISAIFIESSFLSYKKIAKEKIRNICNVCNIFNIFIELFVSDKYSPKKFLDDFNSSEIPFVIIHSANDKVVPIKFGIEIFLYLRNRDFWMYTGEHLSFTETIKNQKKIIDYINTL